jgi:hypothetical protein
MDSLHFFFPNFLNCFNSPFSSLPFLSPPKWMAQNKIYPHVTLENPLSSLTTRCGTWAPHNARVSITNLFSGHTCFSQTFHQGKNQQRRDLSVGRTKSLKYTTEPLNISCTKSIYKPEPHVQLICSICKPWSATKKSMVFQDQHN